MIYDLFSECNKKMLIIILVLVSFSITIIIYVVLNIPEIVYYSSGTSECPCNMFFEV
jgi:hypothetical protein